MNIFRNKKISQTRGFTLVETVVAIFILSLSVGALLTLSTGGIFSVRYARNQMVADNLLQESLEYIRNSRDTAAQQGIMWEDWLETLNVNASGNSVPYNSNDPLGCFSDRGCQIDPYYPGRPIRQCQNSGCDYIQFYPEHGFYGYDNPYPFGQSDSTPTSYIRTINVNRTTENQIVVTARIQWLNGFNEKSVEQSLILTNWQL